MNQIEEFIINDVLILLLSFFFYLFISYFKEKGKNLATKEDIKGITNEVEKVKSSYEQDHIKLQKELETKIEVMKAKLKTSEIYFQKQLEALEEFLKIYREIFPKYDKPDKEWEEACLEATYSLSEIRKKLSNFLTIYEAYLPDIAINKIEFIIHHTIDLSFLTQEDKSIDCQIGNDILQSLQETKNAIIQEIKKIILF